jgi:hypothetical protein
MEFQHGEAAQTRQRCSGEGRGLRIHGEMPAQREPDKQGDGNGLKCSGSQASQALADEIINTVVVEADCKQTNRGEHRCNQQLRGSDPIAGAGNAKLNTVDSRDGQKYEE